MIVHMSSFPYIQFWFMYFYFWCFPGGSVVKDLSANVGDKASVPELGRSPGEGNGNPLQYSCLGKPVDRGARLAI